MTPQTPFGTFLSPASFQDPLVITQSGWLEHGPFASWIVDAIKPRLLVELGTHWGYSFFVFCQRILAADLPTQVVAVDTWEGDEHAGFYNSEVYDFVSATTQERYSDIATLMRLRFDEALTQFEDGSIDLLHIDGRHFYDDAREDFESYLPKMSDAGVILIHDIAVREQGFGVWQLWEEISAQYPSFGFEHGNGLGVVAYGKNAPEVIKRLTELGSESAEAAFVRDAYHQLGKAISGSDGMRRALDLEDQLRHANDEIGAMDLDIKARAIRAEATVLQAQARIRRLTLDNETQRHELYQATRPHPAAVGKIVRGGLRRAGVRLLGSDVPAPELVPQIRTLFDATYYRSQHPELTLDDEQAFNHYLKHGWPNGESPTPLFDASWYLAQNPDVVESGARAFEHFLVSGAAEGRNPNAVFDTAWYVRKHPHQVDASGALVHFVTQGQDHGYNPSRAFQVSWYLSRYPEVRKAGTNALSDYLTEGALRGRDPHPDFDTSWYTLMYPDSLSADLTPLAHYLTVGQFDGRATNAAGAHLAQH